MLVLFIVLFVLISSFLVFYLDLANGPLVLFIIELFVLICAFIFRIICRNKKYKIFAMLFIVVLNIPIIIFAKPSIRTYKPTEIIKETEVLHLLNGDIKGTYNEEEDVMIYAGIPYAEAPVGSLRFREPQDVKDWEGVLDCTSFKPRAMQVDTNPVISSLIDVYSEGGWHPNYVMNPLQAMSEDCLYLNIWKPVTNDDNLPILVYIHGGSLTNGSSAAVDYNGETYAKNGVIMITVAYRLGVFGYFAHQDLIDESINHTTGNYGLLDQIKALEWINKNALFFGGDKSNITIAGESAGSSSVSALCASPLAKGLFKKAIGESSSVVVKRPPHTFRKLDSALKMGEDIMKEFGCKTIDELRQIDASKLVNTKYTNSSMTIDGYALDKSPYEVYLNHDNNEEALLNGYNVKEADAFVIPSFLLSPTNKDNILDRLKMYFDDITANELYEVYKEKIEVDAFSAFNEILSIYWFIYPHESWSNMAKESGVTVYRYHFTKNNGYRDNYHSGELIYVYGNIDKINKDFAYNESDYELEEKMIKYFTNFIKHGNPNGSGLIEWVEYEKQDHNVMIFGDDIKMSIDEYVNYYPIIKKYIDTLK